MTHKRNWSASVLHPTLSLHVHAHMKKEYWSGLPWPPLGDFPDSGIKPTSLKSLCVAGSSLLLVPPGKPSVSLDINL